MGLITPLVCQTCHATIAPDSIIRIEFPIGLDDMDYVEACPCCGDINPTFMPEG